MADVDDISAAVYGAIAGIVLRGRGVNPQAVVAALDRVQGSLEQARAYWLERATEYLAETSLRNLRTEPVQLALTNLVREQVGGQWAYKVRKDTTAAEVFERNGWREVKRRYSIRYFVMPDGAEPPAHLTPVVEFAVPVWSKKWNDVSKRRNTGFEKGVGRSCASLSPDHAQFENRASSTAC